MNCNVERLLLCILFSWNVLIGMETVETKQDWSLLPKELIQKIGAFVFCDDLGPVKPGGTYNAKDVLEALARYHCYFIKRGFFPDGFEFNDESNKMTMTISNPNFNSLCYVSNAFCHAITTISYENKLKWWHEKSFFIQDFKSEVTLLNALIGARRPTEKDDQLGAISIAANFFTLPDFFPVMFNNDFKNQTNHILLKPRGIYSSNIGYVGLVNANYNVPLLCDFKFFFTIYFANMLRYYESLKIVTTAPTDEDVRLNIYNTERKYKVLSFITNNTQFQCNSNFTIDWFEEFILLSLCLLKEELKTKITCLKQHEELLLREGKVKFTEGPLLITYKDIKKQCNRLEEPLARFKKITCSKVPFQKEELFVFLIDHYSKLTISDGDALFFQWYDNRCLNEFSSDQKIIWFYYTHALHLAIQMPSLYSTLFVQDLLSEMQEWLQKTYPKTCVIITKELLANMALGKKKIKFWNCVFQLIGHLVRNTTVKNFFNIELFFLGFKKIFNSEIIVKALEKQKIAKKNNNSIPIIDFFSGLSRELLSAVAFEFKGKDVVIESKNDEPLERADNKVEEKPVVDNLIIQNTLEQPPKNRDDKNLDQSRSIIPEEKELVMGLNHGDNKPEPKSHSVMPVLKKIILCLGGGLLAAFICYKLFSYYNDTLVPMSARH